MPPNTPVTPHIVTAAAENYLERLAAELDVPPSRYESAKRSYHSVGDWLDREDSTLKSFSPLVYIQGSFRLGTPIRPVNQEEHYDIDLVCELTLDKAKVTQQQLKEMLGKEMQLYAKAHSMQAPSEGRRCWTLEYADGAQFHLDALPAIPDANSKRLLLESSGLSALWADTAIAISDNEHPHYRAIQHRWPHSNPKAYTDWFRTRMKVVFETRRKAMALEATASVEDIPAYRVKTPLQEAVQVLKRHRDLMFVNDLDNKPISIILTTLAALSYSNEPTVARALSSILAGMDSHIEDRGGVKWIANPTDPAENFADRWQMYPVRQKNFKDWLSRAREDFAKISAQNNRVFLTEAASSAVGTTIAQRAANSTGSSPRTATSFFLKAAIAITAGHRKVAPWPVVREGTVSIVQAKISRNGFRPASFVSGSEPLPKGASLSFRAKTDVPPPYAIYWQVVNSGLEAINANGLRGGFEEGLVERGEIQRSEGTEYSGSHTIECFIVKNNYLVARSGAFIVNIA